MTVRRWGACAHVVYGFISESFLTELDQSSAVLLPPPMYPSPHSRPAYTLSSYDEVPPYKKASLLTKPMFETEFIELSQVRYFVRDQTCVQNGEVHLDKCCLHCLSSVR